MAVISAWEAGCRDPRLNDVMKEMFELTVSHNTWLKLVYVRSEHNKADAASRTASLEDVSLGDNAWKTVEGLYGPHSVDAMANDNNAKVGKFFTQYWTPKSSGVDMFAQNLKKRRKRICLPVI